MIFALRQLIALVLAVSPAPTAPQISFQEALRQAQENTKSDAGLKYDAASGNAFSQGLVTDFPRCDEKAKGASNFTIVIQVATGGTVEDAMVRPASAFAKCLLEPARKLQFPAPPAPHYWIFVAFTAKHGALPNQH